MFSRSRFLSWLHLHPMLVLTVAAVAGILLSEWLTCRPGVGLAVATLLVWLLFWRRPTLWMALPGVLFSFVFLHALRLQDTFAHPVREHLLTQPEHKKTAAVRGLLYPWVDGAEMDPDAALCEVSQLRWGQAGDWKPVKAKIKVRLPEGIRLTAPGLYEIEGPLTLPGAPANPGQFDGVTYSLRMGCIAVSQARKVTLVKEDPLDLRYRLQEAAEASRQWITRQLTQGLENAQPHAGVILAMALGASDAAGEDIEDAFRDSGTLHVFAVSGLHVAMLAHIASFGLQWLGKQRMSVFLIVLVFAYAFITGWRPSAARAAFMTAFVLAAPLLNRKSQIANTLGAAALLLLVVDTHQLFLPGFQLSFVVLLSIVLVAAGLMEMIKPWCDLDPFLPPVLATRMQRYGVRGRTFAAALVCTSLAAWAGSLPFMIGHFQTVTPVALISNLVLVPASEICLLLSCLSLLLAATSWSWAVVAMNHLNATLASVMVTWASWFASLPGANQTLDLRFEKNPPAAEFHVLQLPYGGGASYLRSGGHHWLLDTGNENNWRYVLRPFLRHQGVDRLDGLVLSHADISHVGAVPWVMSAQKVPQIHTSVLEPWKPDPPFASLKKLSLQVAPDGPVWRRHGLQETIPLTSGEVMPVTARVLHPGTDDLHEKADDRGLVLLLQVGGFRILCLNDAGFITEKRLLERRTDLKCDLLVRHQHSADVSGLTELLLAARPQAIISSNDSYRPEEALPQRLRDFCLEQRLPLFDLEADGSIGIAFRESEATLKAFKNGRSLNLRPQGQGVAPP
ncbi:hypothetical protein GCM10023213_11090 [Prosthecobacter algae]|uniref:Competence protein ComEC n=1 Tax=Prosthecobacter algae TaxID=1144682 RepID=A0ABP9NYH6_9BACT